MASAPALRGFARRLMLVRVGTSSCRRPSRFEVILLEKKLTPVTLPPGRFRLATTPS